jgi:hypothetical protein
MKKRIWLIVLISFLITVLSISSTFALFETNAGAESELDIGKWKILVNDNDISLAETITLNDFTYSTSSHTQDGYFAPVRSASFDVEIDTSQSDVSVIYELNIDDSALEDHPNISFNIVNLNTNQSINSTTYGGIIYLNDQDRTVTLRISLVWADVLANDPDDTALIGEELEFVINANFKQYLGE